MPETSLRRLRRRRLREQLRGLTTLPGLSKCGRRIVSKDGCVELRIQDGVAHFTGLASCGSVWACPCCGPKIRQVRAVEIGTAINRALDRGWGVEFLTLTVRHHRGQALADLYHASEAAWKAVQQQRRYRDLMVQLGGRGLIQVREITLGDANGWHPHRHAAVMFERPLTAEQRQRYEQVLWEVWNAQLLKRGLNSLRSVGALVKPCTAAEGLGWYLAKVEGKSSIGLEMARGDLKRGRAGHRTPEELLDDALATGEAKDAYRWVEFEEATKGRKMLTWSHGLRAELLGDEVEQTDQEIAAAEVGGGLVLVLNGHNWRWFRRFSPGAVALLEAAEEGSQALWAYVGEILAVPGAPPLHSVGGTAFTAELGSALSIAR